MGRLLLLWMGCLPLLFLLEEEVVVVVVVVAVVVILENDGILVWVALELLFLLLAWIASNGRLLLSRC